MRPLAIPSTCRCDRNILSANRNGRPESLPFCLLTCLLISFLSGEPALPSRLEGRDARPPPYDVHRRYRNFTSASVVSLGRSSSTQCPVSFSTTTFTSEATNFICCASASPSDFSPPITRTGMVSLVWES